MDEELRVPYSGNHDAKRGTRRSYWGLSSLRSKLSRNDTKSPSTGEGVINRRVKNDDETRDWFHAEAHSDDDDDDDNDGIDDDDFEGTGKQIQFLSNVVNKFGSFDSHDHHEAASNDHKLLEVIRTTERLERKLEDIGDPTKPTMTPNEVGELISVLTKMHVQAAHLKRNYPVESGLADGHAVEPTQGHDENSNWLDTITKAMFGHCEWK